MGLLALAAWLIQHPYAGIKYDSVLYTLFALAKLHPDTVGSDIFLRFGSQDRFTLFAPIYAAAMNPLGMAHAAALLLFISQAAFFTIAWRLARRFMSTVDAMLSVALLALLPGEYGQGATFFFLEGILTPRLPAEALVLGAVLAAVTHRYWIAVSCVAAAMLIHPLMGVAGAAFLYLTFLVPRYPRLTLAAAGVGFLATLGAVVALAPLGRVLDKEWLFAIYSTNSYLFVTMWWPSDWARSAVYLVVPIIGCWVGATPLLRKVCAGVVATAACGLTITLVFCDLLHVSLFINLQSWRWLWFADVMAVILGPAIILDCWQRGYSGRIAVVTFAIAWVFRDLAADLGVVALVIGCAAIPNSWNRHGYLRALFLAACALLGLAICLDMSERLTYPAASAHGISPLLQWVRSACVDGVIPGLVLIATCLVARGSVSAARQSIFTLTTALAAALVCAVLIPSAWTLFSANLYPLDLLERFAPWRAAIPPRAETLWLGNPVATWYLLDRPSYLSGPQMAGAIFSREKAALTQRRSAALSNALKSSNLTDNSRPTAEELDPTNSPQMDLKAIRAVCGDPDLKYFVSWIPVAPTPFPPVTVDPSRPEGKVYLYRCADLRS